MVGDTVSLESKNKRRTQRRTLRVRAKLQTGKPRISVFRSLKHMYAQLIDEQGQKTVMSCSSLDLKKVKGDKKAIAFAIGRELAQKAAAEGITTAIFDRGQFLYHGRVKSLAEGLREGGLKI